MLTDKERMELMNLRKRVKSQRETIKALQAGKGVWRLDRLCADGAVKQTNFPSYKAAMTFLASEKAKRFADGGSRFVLNYIECGEGICAFDAVATYGAK